MGIPKFFRYISERYPCIIQIVEEDQIPEFDNCYLDMNGIIHNCSHPDAFGIKLDEEFVFREILKYIDLIFHYLKPKKVFFMAIDGVAPRAKMNQQRSRRFRTAEESEQALKKLRKQFKNGKVPELFDSNCITPGTVFMDRLHEHLKYFITWKLSTDPLWQQCEQIIYSGHQTPGEGEHKIMDYIRYARSQPDYNPNTRHCLYGLDADLIILGLCTHDLNITLFREEVLYAKKRVPSSKDHLRFCLLHISMLRSYLYEEFVSLRSQLTFEFNFEKIIDDWILFLFLIGNDFIPNLPNFLIHHNCIAALCNIYKELLPKLKGYLHDDGLLNLENFQCFLSQMASIDLDRFEEDYELLKYMETKTGRKHGADEVLDGEDDSGIVMAEQFRQFKSNYYSEKLDLDSSTKTDAQFLENQAKEYIRAIQWNLFYYYDGVCSWSWYFPQHYAPYISDLKNFENIRLDFERGEPFRPFEQLLSVMPSSSCGLLPKCYQSLMTDANSPIIDYYPQKFVKDLNGKRNDWEAVVKIPFIDEQKMFEAMRPLNEQLSADEVRRNQHECFYVYRYSPDEATKQPYQAPPGFFPIPQNLSVCETFAPNHFYLPREKIRKGLLPGAVTNQICLGFPTLHFVAFTARLDKPTVRVHEQRSIYENTILDIEPSPPFDFRTLAARHLGQQCHVFWPYLRQAIIVKIATYDHFAEVSPDGLVNFGDATSVQKTQWLKDVKNLESYYLYKHGVNLEKRVACLIYTRFKIGHKVTLHANNKRTPAIDIQWSQLINPYPLQLVIFDLAQSGVHEKHLELTALSNSLMPNRTGYFLGYMFYGSPVTIQEVASSGELVKIAVRVTNEPDFSQLSRLPGSGSSSLLTLEEILQSLRLSRGIFTKIISKVLVKRKKINTCDRDEIVDIGLNVRLSKAKMWCPEYVVYSNNDWYYTPKLITLIGDYMSVLSTVFATLSSNVDVLFFDEEDLFDGSSVTLEDVLWFFTRIRRDQWQREFGMKEIIAEPQMRQLEQCMLNYRPEYKTHESMNVKPAFIFLRELQSDTIAPDPNADFQLLDRVVNISLNVPVPFGFKGTIIGKKWLFPNEDEELALPSHRRTSTTRYAQDDFSALILDVLFDENFVGGISVNCSDEKVFKLRAYCLLNISYGQRRDAALKASRNPNLSSTQKFPEKGAISIKQPNNNSTSLATSKAEYLKVCLKMSSNSNNMNDNRSDAQLTEISEMESNECKWKDYNQKGKQQRQPQQMRLQKPVDLNPLFTHASKSKSLTKNIETLQNISSVSQIEESLKKLVKSQDSQSKQTNGLVNKNSCDTNVVNRDGQQATERCSSEQPKVEPKKSQLTTKSKKQVKYGCNFPTKSQS